MSVKKKDLVEENQDLGVAADPAPVTDEESVEVVSVEPGRKVLPKGAHVIK